MLRLLAVAGLVCVPAMAGQTPDGATRACVDDAVASWRREARPTPEALAPALIACGPEAEPYLRQLVACRDAVGVPLLSLTLALGQPGAAPETLEVLTRLLAADAAEHRVQAAQALGRTGAPEALPALLAALDDAVQAVRAAAADAILDVQRQDPELDVVERLAELARELEHLDSFALLLGRLGTPPARDLLLDLLERWDDPSAIQAGLAGLWIGGEAEDAVHVRELLAESYPVPVRRKACLVLGRLGDRASLRDLLDLLQAEERGLVADAHWALRRITGLGLRADPELWETWWERVGSRASDRD